jgi:uncharacterized protein with PhoU and TrkA domain
MLYEATIS